MAQLALMKQAVTIKPNQILLGQTKHLLIIQLLRITLQVIKLQTVQTILQYLKTTRLNSLIHQKMRLI